MNSSPRVPASSHYQGLILDFGGVIAKSFFETRAEFEKLLGLAEETLPWRGPFDVGSDLLWQEVVTGKFSEGEYWLRRAEEVGALVGERWTFQDFCRRQKDLSLKLVVRPEAEELVMLAKRNGVKLAVLTNELESLTGKNWINSIPLVSEFDAFLDATRTHVRKPDSRAYRLALDAIGLSAGQAIFIDDQQENVLGAEATGIRAIHLDICDPRRAFDNARELLGITVYKS